MNAVDTNILIYACDLRDPRRHQIALDLLDSISDGVLLCQVACEYIAAARKLRDQAFSTKDAWDNLADLLTAFTLVTPRADVLTHARAFHLNHQCSFWDAMIYAACRDAGVTRIYSEDLPGSPLNDLEVVNPFASA
jgi:predicted nucleic acid-binding protein